MTLEWEISEEDAKLRQLDERYWLSNVSLSAEKYKSYLDHIKMEKALNEAKLEQERKKESNYDFYLNEVLAIAREVQYLWASADLETKLRIQKNGVPRGFSNSSRKTNLSNLKYQPLFSYNPSIYKDFELG